MADYLLKESLDRMCEAQVEAVKCTYELSRHMTVSVTGTGQVSFKCIPDKDFMKPTEVSLSAKAWNAYVSDARSGIQKCLQTLEEKTWEYYPNSKFVRVTHGIYGTQIALLTINRKGTELRKYSIYLTEEEWSALDRCTDDLCASLKMMQKQHLKNGKEEISVYKWKFSPDVPSDDVPDCNNYYYVDEHAREKGMELAITWTSQLGCPQVIKEVRPPPDPLKFYMMVFFTLLYKCCVKFNEVICTGCKDNEPGHHPSHRHYNGCKAYARCVIQDYLGKAKQAVSQKCVNEVFFRCWKFLNLNMVDVDKLWKAMEVMMFEDEFLRIKLAYIKDNVKSCPETLLISDYIKDVDVTKWVNGVADAHSDVGVDEPDTKKLHLGPDSDEEYEAHIAENM